METMQGIALRGICSTYFENNVAPILKYVQQAQEQLSEQTKELKHSLKEQSQELRDTLKNQESKDVLKQQIQELRDDLGQKANAETSLNEIKRNQADLETLAAKVKAIEQSVNLGNSGVSMLGRIQDLQSVMKKKVDIGSVPTMEHLKSLRELVQQKANAKEVVTPEMLKAALDRRPAASGMEAPERQMTASEIMRMKMAARRELVEGSRFPVRSVGMETTPPELTGELELGMDKSCDSSPRTAMTNVQALQGALRHELETDSLKHLSSLREELQERIAGLESRLDKLTSGQQSASAATEVKKMQIVMSAASSNFNRQLKDVKQQLQALSRVQEQGVSLASLKGSPDPFARENSAASAASSSRGPKENKSFGLASLKGDADPFPRENSGASCRSPRENLGRRTSSTYADREETMSIAESDEGSVTASVAGSTVSALSPEERTELKRMQAVVAAAGTVFNKELRDVRKQLNQLQSEVEVIKAESRLMNETIV